MSGVLMAELKRLEKNAQALEKVVGKELFELDFVPEKKRESFESLLLAKLRKLDNLQDEIDTVVVRLKESGAWEPVSYESAKYEYRRPKVKKAEPVKKEYKPRKVYSTETKAEEKSRLAKQAREDRRRERERLKAIKDAEKAAKASEQAQKAADKVSNPKPATVNADPKSPEQLKAERGLYDCKVDRGKVDGVFERQRIKDEAWLAKATAELVEFEKLSTAEKGPQKRNRARTTIASVTERLNTIEERKAARHAEIDAREVHWKEVLENM